MSDTHDRHPRSPRRRAARHARGRRAALAARGCSRRCASRRAASSPQRCWSALLGFATVTQVQSNRAGRHVRRAPLRRPGPAPQRPQRRGTPRRQGDRRPGADPFPALRQHPAARRRRSSGPRRSRRRSASWPAPCPPRGPASGSRSPTPRTRSPSTTCSTGVEELRAAGAEAIEFNDDVRVVAQTSFEDAERGVVVDGRRISAPYVIDVIGDPRHPGRRRSTSSAASAST